MGPDFFYFWVLGPQLFTFGFQALNCLHLGFGPRDELHEIEGARAAAYTQGRENDKATIKQALF